jgi:3-methyladenine DNA glycosylase AlkD
MGSPRQNCGCACENLMRSQRLSHNVADEIRHVLRRDGSRQHARGVQWFFKDEIASHGWYAADLRRLARQYRRDILKAREAVLLQVADDLFRGRNLEEKVVAVLLLENMTAKFGAGEFKLFESWLKRISSWAEHDALAHYLIGPMFVAEPARVARVNAWAKSRNRWQRRAACVALIQGTRKRMFLREIKELTETLVDDEDDMVQKGLGWLLRETAKADPQKTIPYLMTIRNRAPRLVLRTACETLSPSEKARILGKRVQ